MMLLPKIILRPGFRILNILIGMFGFVAVRKVSLQRKELDYYLHEYESYEEYREAQIQRNKSLIKRDYEVWADETTLKRVAEIVKNNSKSRPIRGLCHGARTGFEQNYLNGLGIGIEAIGTDISETALDYENSVQWDFHDSKKEWLGKFDFVYTNAFDHAWKPKEALSAWLGQIKPGGVVIIEHTEDGHDPAATNESDPFGVRPTVMPYVLTMWFGKQISISHSVADKDNIDSPAWLFVISKNTKNVKPL